MELQLESLSEPKFTVSGAGIVLINFLKKNRIYLENNIQLSSFTNEGSKAILVIGGHLDKPLIRKIAKKIQGALVKPFDRNALLEGVKKHAE